MAAKHEPLIKTPKQLIIVVALSFIIPVAVVVLLTQLFTGGGTGMKDSESAVLARIKPVGDVVMAEASGPKGQMTGEQVVNQVCKTCHEPGIAGAHKVGDKAAWAKVIAQGPDTTFQHAISGVRAMPPKGGNPDLADVEVQRAVVFMVNKSGGNWKEPPAPANTAAAAPGAATPSAAASAPATPGGGAAPQTGMSKPTGAGNAAAAAGPGTTAAPPASAAMQSAAAGAAAKPDGKKAYDTVCMACHTPGVAGAPKLGDKAAWAPRIKTGVDALHASALKGKGAMPPKGGNTSLSDAEVSAAVDYMVSASK